METSQATRSGPFVGHNERRAAVVLDASALWLEGVEAVVRRLGFDVVAKATSCSHALAAVEEYQPLLLVTDLTVADPDDGLRCMAHALAERPNLRVVVLSLGADPELIYSALAQGAAAYVMKTAHPDDLASAIRQAFDPSVYFAGGSRQSLVPVVAPVAEGVSAFEDASLTRREREILKLLAEGHSNAQLARLLWVAEQTVKFHLSNVYRKLGVANRTEASRWAQVNGLLATQPSSFAAELRAV